MSGELSESKQRALAREAERERAREQRKTEAAARRAARGSSGGGGDEESHDPMAAAGWDRKGDRARQAERSSAAAAGSGGSVATMTHEDQVISHAAKLQQDNRETLQRTIRTARETTQVGAETIHKLNEQTEQFHRMDQNLDATQESLTRSERILRGMKSFGGALTNLFTSDKSHKKHSAGSAGDLPASSSPGGASRVGMDGLEERDRMRENRKAAEADRAAGQMQFIDNEDAFPAKVGTRNNSSAAASSSSSPTAPNARQSAALQTIAANQAAEDEALDELSDVLGALKEQSTVMNQQLATQAKLLDGIEGKVEVTSDRLQKGSRTMSKIT